MFDKSSVDRQGHLKKSEESMTVHVLHITTRFLKGGTEKNILNSIGALDSEKYSSELIVGKDSDLNLIPRGIKTLKVNRLIRSANPIINLTAAYSIYKILRGGRYTIVHTHQANAGMAGRLAAKIAGVPIIIHGLHGSTFHSSQNIGVRWLYIFLEKLAAKFTTCFTVVGYDLRDRYIRAGIGGQSDYHIIRSGMNLDKFRKAGAKNSEERGRIKEKIGVNKSDVLIIVVAALEPRKGHRYLIDIAKRLTDNGIKFLFAGDGWYRSELQKKVRDENLDNRILFLGHRTDVEEIMAASDILALTSLWEGLPQVLVQGAAVWLPMVSFAVEGANEVIKDGVNGYIVPIGDISAFEEKLRWLIKNPKTAREMGKRGNEIIDKEWEIPRMQMKINELYDRLMKERL